MPNKYGTSSGHYHGMEKPVYGKPEKDRLGAVHNAFGNTGNTNVFKHNNVPVPDGPTTTNTLMNDRSRWGGGPKKPKPKTKQKPKTEQKPIPPISTILPGDNRHVKAVKTIYHTFDDDSTIFTKLITQFF